VRLISASNRDIDGARSDGFIRDDFYYRINVVNIHVPPLRERREDIPLLAEHFLRQQLKTSSKVINGFDQRVLQQFEQYDWPGNVRELENAVERACAMTTGKKITLKELPPKFSKDGSIQPSPANSLSLTEAKKHAIEQIERNYLLTLLEECRGNVTQIAQKAQMTRRNLHRLLNRYGLDAAAWRTKSEK
jgi:two-component system response regulator HydG